VKDKKTGRIIETKPYRLKCSKEHGWIYEKGGQLYTEAGLPLDPLAGILAKEAELKVKQAEIEAIKNKLLGVKETVKETLESVASSVTVDPSRLQRTRKNETTVPVNG
jgi:hypothetical protein